MTVDLDELEKLFAEWKAHGGPATFMPLDEALYSAAPSLLAELRDARARIADLENSMGPCGCEPDRCEQHPEAGAVYYGRLCRTARLLRPAKETP